MNTPDPCPDAAKQNALAAEAKSSRRDLLARGGAVLAGLALGPIQSVGCSDDGTVNPDAAGSIDADVDAVVALDNEVGSDSIADVPAEASGPPTLASGGTKSVSGTYRDPFAGLDAPVCTLTCQQTGGPCYAPSPFRKDISAGKTGLPMRLALRIRVAGTCAPIANADVELWACDADGVYSGQTPSPICAGDELEARELDFMRGRQSTTGDGRVDFDLVLPGWYPTRAPHLHLRVNIGGDAYVTTQLYFEDATVGPVYETHPDYLHRGRHATTLATDGVIGGEGPAQPFVVATEVTPQGALLAWMDIALRSSIDAANCSPADA